MENPNQYLLDLIPNEWIDKDALLEKLFPAIIINFVEVEKALELVQFDDKKELIKHYDIAKQIQNLDKEIEISYKTPVFSPEVYDKQVELEDKRHELLTKLMIWMVTNRHTLWC